MYMGSAARRTVSAGLAHEPTTRSVREGGGVTPRIWLGPRVECFGLTHDTMDNIACAGHRLRGVPLCIAPKPIDRLYISPIDHTMASQPVESRRRPRLPITSDSRVSAKSRDQALVAGVATGRCDLCAQNCGGTRSRRPARSTCW